jgi:hypothetical protein
VNCCYKYLLASLRLDFVKSFNVHAFSRLKASWSFKCCLNSSSSLRHTYFLQETSDSQLAKETLGGRMTQDFVAERLKHSNFSQITELDCPQSGIQAVDLGDGQLFQRLRR